MTPVLNRLTVFIPRPHFALSLFFLFFFISLLSPCWPPNSSIGHAPFQVAYFSGAVTNHTREVYLLALSASERMRRKMRKLKKEEDHTVWRETMVYWKSTKCITIITLPQKDKNKKIKQECNMVGGRKMDDKLCKI